MKRSANRSEQTAAFGQNYELYSLGEDAFRKGCFAEARKYFKVALEYCPDDSDTWRALGTCYDELKQPKKAEACLRKALEFADAESVPDITFSLGNSLYDQEKYAEALQLYLEIPKGATVWRQASRNILLTRKMLSPEKDGA